MYVVGDPIETVYLGLNSSVAISGVAGKVVQEDLHRCGSQQAWLQQLALPSDFLTTSFIYLTCLGSLVY